MDINYYFNKILAEEHSIYYYNEDDSMFGGIFQWNFSRIVLFMLSVIEATNRPIKTLPDWNYETVSPRNIKLYIESILE